ncbi:MAG: hemolysin family protein [Syntrophaceae bacterium]
MDYLITYKIILLVFLFILSGFFSCSEAALFSLTPLHLHKMKEDRSPFLSSVRKLLDHPRRLLITILVSNESVNITISVVMASLCIYYFGVDGQWVAVVITTPMLLVFGEAIPKTFAVIRPIPLSSFVSPFLMMISYIERPIVWTLEKISGLFVYIFSCGPSAERSTLTEDEFKALIDVYQKEGGLEEAQRDLIHRVFNLADKPVSDVMIPRVEMFCLPISLSMAEMEKEIIMARHTRIPIYGTDRDDIQGILFARDIIRRISGEGKAFNVSNLLRKPYFVPEGKTAGSLLRDFQTRKIQIAIVVDEYGGVSGMVTLEDILESLFEDVYDDHSIGESLWQRIDERTVMVSGKMFTEDLNKLIDMSIPEEDFDTVGGFVFHLFGKLPTKGEEVHYGDYTFRIEKMGKARILNIKIQRHEEPNSG